MLPRLTRAKAASLRQRLRSVGPEAMYTLRDAGPGRTYTWLLEQLGSKPPFDVGRRWMRLSSFVSVVRASACVGLQNASALLVAVSSLIGADPRPGHAEHLVTNGGGCSYP